jgi:26S proteasome regulatory subunit N1
LDNREEQEDDGDEEPVLQVEDLMTLVDDIVPFQMKHNAEAEAVDLLLEVKQLGKLLALTATANGETSSVVDGRNYERVCLYLLRTTSFIVDPEDLSTIYHTAYSIYMEQKKLSDALRVAVKIDDPELIDALFAASTSAAEKKQMALILARQRSYYRVSSVDPDSAECEAEAEALNELVGNSGLSERFVAIAREMNITVPKLPEDIYKSSAAGALTHAQTLLGRSNAAANFAVDSARANLAATFVNAFVNAAYCKDKLIIDPEGQDGAGNINSWLFKNKGHGMMSAAASLGMLMLWNVDEGLNQIDKYFHNSEDFVKAGACLGVGILSSGVRNEAEPALALLSDALSAANASTAVKTASICGLGIAYAGARNEDVRNLLEGVLSNDSGSTDYITEASMAALALGFAYVGTCDDDISSGILTRMMESSEADLNHTSTRFMCLGLGLLYLGKGDRVEPVLEAVKTIEHRRGKYCEATLETCAYAGTGNVLKVQQMLRLCTEHITDSAAAEHQAVAVLGIALVTGEYSRLHTHTYILPISTCTNTCVVGEEIGTEMTLRTFEHLLHYGELPVKRVVPLALALLYVSNPEYSIIDQLSRLSHDQDAEIAQCAIFGLGLISAGSNNSRVAGLLRSLSEFYVKEANHLFVVRIAQGLNAMGKGLIGLSPFHSDRFPVR